MERQNIFMNRKTHNCKNIIFTILIKKEVRGFALSKINTLCKAVSMITCYELRYRQIDNWISVKILMRDSHKKKWFWIKEKKITLYLPMSQILYNMTSCQHSWFYIQKKFRFLTFLEPQSNNNIKPPQAGLLYFLWIPLSTFPAWNFLLSDYLDTHYTSWFLVHFLSCFTGYFSSSSSLNKCFSGF